MHQSHLLQSAFIYLATAVVIVPVAQRLGLGSVLGYLIGGALIGPSVLGWVGGRQGEEALHFAEFGVVIMLFVIGLELNPGRLWRMRGPILGLGGLQVAATSLVAMGVAVACGMEFRPAIATGMILALSSTAIVVQSLQERGLLRSDGGQDTFAVLLFQDVSVIPMLAVFPLLGQGGAVAGSDGWLQSLPYWVQPPVIVGAVVLIVLIGQFIVPRGFAILARTGLRELLTAAALLLVVGVTLLMTLVGLSPALGAFVAGVVLAGSHYRHELESNLEPFKGLLLGLFFLAVGASLDVGVIAAAPVTVSLLVGGLILLKAAVIVGLATMLGLRGPRRWLPALALAQGGEFAFALLAVTVRQGIFGTETAQLLMAVVALSMAATPLLFIVYERLIAPRFTAPVAPVTRAPDAIDEHAPVILAGFGRFGNFLGRFLMSQGVRVTVLESDPDHVDMLRAFGFKVFYGDATRLDLLHAAGIGDACLLLISLADQAKVAQLITAVKEHHPGLRIMARAHDYDQRLELMRLGLPAEDTVHEQTGSALDLAVRALVALGKPPDSMERAVQEWRRYDEETFHLLVPAWDDFDTHASIVRQRRVQLTQLFEKDRVELEGSGEAARTTG